MSEFRHLNLSHEIQTSLEPDCIEDSTLEQPKIYVIQLARRSKGNVIVYETKMLNALRFCLRSILAKLSQSSSHAENETNNIPKKSPPVCFIITLTFIKNTK